MPPETAGESQIDSYSPERSAAARDQRARHVFDGVRAQIDGVDVQIEDPFPRCLYASYCYQNGAISPQSMAQVERMMHCWRERLTAQVSAVATA